MFNHDVLKRDTVVVVGEFQSQSGDECHEKAKQFYRWLNQFLSCYPEGRKCEAYFVK